MKDKKELLSTMRDLLLIFFIVLLFSAPVVYSLACPDETIINVSLKFWRGYVAAGLCVGLLWYFNKK